MNKANLLYGNGDDTSHWLSASCFVFETNQQEPGLTGSDVTSEETVCYFHDQFYVDILRCWHFCQNVYKMRDNYLGIAL